MLKGIHPAISPELLKTLAEMGHGDEIILADAHFPGHSVNTRVIRADGLLITTMLDAILPLFELDSYADPLVMMPAVQGDQLDPAIEEKYMAAVHRHVSAAKSLIAALRPSDSWPTLKNTSRRRSLAGRSCGSRSVNSRSKPWSGSCGSQKMLRAPVKSGC